MTHPSEKGLTPWEPLSNVSREDLNRQMLESERIFLASDVMVSKYGIVGYLVVDNQPEDREVSYTESEHTGMTLDNFATFGTEHILVYNPQTGEKEFSSDEVRLSHYFQTHKGFKMLRRFILPKGVASFFAKDRFFGDPAIDRCCREGTLPEDYDEEIADLRCLSLHAEKESIEKIDKIILPYFIREPFVNERGWERENFLERTYISFHRWPFYSEVLGEGTESIKKALDNFDIILSKFDTGGPIVREEKPEPKRPELPGVIFLPPASSQ